MRKPAKLVRLRGGSNGFSFSKTPRPLTFLRRKSAALPRRNHSTHRRFRHQPHRDNNNNNKRTTSFASPSAKMLVRNKTATCKNNPDAFNVFQEGDQFEMSWEKFSLGVLKSQMAMSFLQRSIFYPLINLNIYL